jgi:hypothetical protein
MPLLSKVAVTVLAHTMLAWIKLSRHCAEGTTAAIFALAIGFSVSCAQPANMNTIIDNKKERFD